MSWLVYRLTHSVMLLGTVACLGQLPTLFFSPVAGVLADRYDKRKLIIATQMLAMTQAALLAFVVMNGTVQVWHIIVLGVLLGFANAFDMPIRQSFVVEMLGDRADLANAIALNSSMVNVARLIGPTAAGLLLAAVGEGPCFLINALSFLAVLVALFAMDTKPAHSNRNRESLVNGLKAGFAYIKTTPPIGQIIMLLGLVSLTGMSFQVLMPAYVKDILGGGPRALGLMSGASGLGALIMAVVLAAKRDTEGLLQLIPRATLVFGAGLLILSLAGSLIPALCVMPFLGLAMMTQIAVSNTMIQTLAHDRMRGRVMAYYTMSFLGLAPLGSLFAGALGHTLGVRGTLAVNGALCICGGLVFVFRLGKIPSPTTSPSPDISAA